MIAALLLVVDAVRERGQRAQGAGRDDGSEHGWERRDADVRAAAEQSVRARRFQSGDVRCWICKVSLGQGIRSCLLLVPVLLPKSLDS